MKAEIHAETPNSLGDIWRRLHDSSPDPTPFTSAEWAQAWWDHYGAGAEPVTVLVTDGGEPVGLAAFALGRRGPARVLGTVGVEPGDYWDVLAAAEHREAVARAVATEVARIAGRWDVMLVKLVPPGSPLPGALALPRLRVLSRDPIPSPALALPQDFDSYLEGLSKSRRQNLRRHLRRLDDDTVTMREPEAADLTSTLARWQGFRAAQWQAAGRAINPEHLSGRFGAFILAAVTEMVPRGSALVWEFRQDDEPVGCYVNFADSRAFYWYLGGFDPSVTQVGLGKIAIAHGIRTSIEAGRERFDFTRGREDYKYFYGAEDRELPALVVGSGRLRSRVALAAARLADRRPIRGR